LKQNAGSQEPAFSVSPYKDAIGFSAHCEWQIIMPGGDIILTCPAKAPTALLQQYRYLFAVIPDTQPKRDCDMVTINNPQPPAQINNSSNAGLIILALVILAAILAGGYYFMNYGGTTTTNTNTVDRTVTRVEQVPAQVGNAVDNATTNNPANTTPPANTEPAPPPAQ